MRPKLENLALRLDAVVDGVALRDVGVSRHRSKPYLQIPAPVRRKLNDSARRRVELAVFAALDTWRTSIHELNHKSEKR